MKTEEMADRIAEALCGAPHGADLETVDHGDLVLVVSLALQSSERTTDQQDALVRIAAMLDNPFVSWSAEAIFTARPNPERERVEALAAAAEQWATAHAEYQRVSAALDVGTAGRTTAYRRVLDAEDAIEKAAAR